MRYQIALKRDWSERSRAGKWSHTAGRALAFAMALALCVGLASGDARAIPPEDPACSFHATPKIGMA